MRVRKLSWHISTNGDIVAFNDIAIYIISELNGDFELYYLCSDKLIYISKHIEICKEYAQKHFEEIILKYVEND